MIRPSSLFWIALPLAAGCSNIAVPRLLHPGTEEYQQTRAEQFDPYPLPDVGPNIVGGRPLQYIQPAPWAERVQNDMTFTERFHQSPPPGLYKPPRTSGNRQGIIYPVPTAVPLGVEPLVVPPPGTEPSVVPLPPGAAPPFVPQEARNWRPAG
jgi:hypothetical protein